MRDFWLRSLAASVAILCICTGIWQLERERSGISIEPLMVGTTPATIYQRTGGAKAPAVVIAHGFAGSRQLMEAYAGWAWVKVTSGILIFEGGFVGVQGPMQEEAERSALALAGQIDPTSLTGALTAERNTLWMLLAVATANVVLGIWRPRFTRLPDQA